MSALTCHAGPFDHPALPLSNGYTGVLVTDGRTAEVIATLPATGSSGLTAEGKPCFPNAGSNLFGDLQAAFNAIVQQEQASSRSGDVQEKPFWRRRTKRETRRRARGSPGVARLTARTWGPASG
jgi:hypothetical protein